MIQNVTMAFLVAWLVAVVVHVGALLAVGGAVLIGTMLTIGLVAAIYLLVVGVPLCLMYRGAGSGSSWTGCLFGVVASLPAIVTFGALEIYSLAIASLLTGAVAGWLLSSAIRPNKSLNSDAGQAGAG